jgi:hypothetical protein
MAEFDQLSTEQLAALVAEGRAKRAASNGKNTL